MAKKVKKTEGELIKSTKPEIFVVRGQIRQADGSVLVGGRIKSFDKEMRSEEMLGEALTDKDGRYEITYTAKTFQRAEKKSADLVVRVFSKGHELVSSKIIFNAKPVETVDLVIGGGEYRGPSEYERLIELTPVLQGIPLADLKEDDYTFLAGELGTNRENVRLLVEAEYLSNEAKKRRSTLPREVFYGLLRQNLPSTLSALLAQHPEVLRHALEVAVRGNLITLAPKLLLNTELGHVAELDNGNIPSSLRRVFRNHHISLSRDVIVSIEERGTRWLITDRHNGEAYLVRKEENTLSVHSAPVESVLARLGQLIVKHALEPTSETAGLPLGALLRASNLPAAKQETFVDLYVRHQGPASKFWDALREHPEFKGGSIVDDLQLTFQLGTLTRKHPPLLKRLQSKKQHGEWSSLRDLAKYEAEDWEAIVREPDVGVPSGIPGNPDEQVRGYGAAIARSIERAFPTAVIASRVTKAARPDERDLVQFLKNNNPHFEFGSTHVDSFLAGPEGEAALAGVNDGEALRRDLKRWQRVFNVTPRYGEMRVLMDGGINSALQIAGMGQTNFAREFGGLFGDRTTEILAEATHRTALAQAVYGQFAPWANFPVHVIPHPPSQVENFSDWASLFGSLSFCECEHCRSVLSPAAYLVDLLHFFKEKGLRLSKTVDGIESERFAIDVLLERRPDIAQIQLSCANTNTLVPHIDLVNEILENAIAPMARTPQTDSTAQELEVNPEHVNVDAYDTLADAIYPWSLPFDLLAAEIRTYLEHLGSPRHELMSVFQREGRDGAQSEPTTIEIACERLGLTKREWDVITGAAPESGWQIWGYAQSEGWVRDIRNVLTFLQRSALSYQELLELLSVRYLRNNVNIRIAFASPCNLEGAVIDASLNSARLLRAHRFLRLQRKLGWTMRELDQTITALQPGGLNDDFLFKVSFIKALRQQLNVPLVSMLAWWGRKVDTTRYRIQGQPETPTFYSRLFLNKTVMNPDDASFILDDTGELPDSAISGHIPAITAALGITEAELSLLTSGERALQLLSLPASEVPNDDLTVDNLSHLYRVVSFSKALGLSLRDFLALKALTGIRPLARVSPFEPASPEDTLRFVEVVRKVRSSSFSIAQLDYLLRHIDQTPRGLRPTEEQVALILTEIANGLDKIVAETTYETAVVQQDNVEITIGLAPAGALLKDKLAILLPAAVVDAVLQLINKDPGLSDPESLIRDHLGVFLNVESAIASLVGAGATIQAPEARIAYVLAPLMRHLRQILSERLVKYTLATRFQIDNAAMHSLLIQFVRSPGDSALRAIDEFLLPAAPDNPAAQAERFKRQFETYLRLHKIAMLIGGLGVRTNELPWLFTHGGDVGWLALATLPTALPAREDLLQGLDTWKERFDGWARLLDVYRLLHWLPALRDPLTADGWQRLAVDFNLTDRLDVEAPALFNLFSFAAEFDEASWGPLAQEALLDVLGSRTGWSTPDLLHIAGAAGLNLSLPAAARNELALLRINACFSLANRLGVSVAHLSRWGQTTGDRDTARETAASIKRTVKAKYSDDQWLLVAKPIRDALREQQRAALVSYLTSHPDHAGRTFQDTNDLFKQFLIDIEMSACMATSRIRQAIGSVQLFIQRCLMNLEEAGAPLAGEDWATYWRWMKNYRVWEANRKVFLYPENWIEPELRDDKSPFFTALESDLLQKEMTTSTAEAAFSSYLEKLDEVARLEIVGLYQETEARPSAHPALRRIDPDIENAGVNPAVEELQQKLNADGAEPPLEVNGVFQDSTREAVRAFQTKHGSLEVDGVVGPETWAVLDRVTGSQPGAVQPRNLLHVYGRTRSAPLLHYYRKRGEGTWTAWEPIDLDIEGNHLIPVVWNRRRYLFWPIFSERADESRPLPNQNAPDDEKKPVKHWEIRLAWSEYKNNKWAAKKISNEAIEFSHVFADLDNPLFQGPTWRRPDQETLFFDTATSDDELIITCKMARVDSDRTQLIASFRFIGSDATGVLTYHTSVERDHVLVSSTGHVPPPRSHLNFMRFVEDTGDHAFALLSGNVNDPAVPVLANTPGTFAISFAAQFSHFYSQTPFFYNDDTRAFFVTGLTEETTTETLEGSFTESWKQYQFRPFYHPYASDFIRQVIRFGIDGLLDPGGAGHEAWRLRRQLNRRDFFERDYAPEDVVLRPYPVEDVDVSEQGAYALYNWELFFHAPLLIADRLSTNQRFEEAQKWFHYIFDPTERSNEPGTRRYWKFRKFYEDARFYDRAQENPPTVEELMANMPELEQQVNKWRKHPFNPHLIARMRTTAYQKTVVMKYIDNLIAWGDQLFRRDTRESIDEATLLYILAAQILGERPQRLPADDVGSKTYAELEPDLDAFSNAALLESESLLVAARGGGRRVDVDEQGNAFFGEGVLGKRGEGADVGVEEIPLISRTLYFCIPPNEKLLDCWDTVANRLFKIRHCMNIEGVIRQLPLFEPPIDPALLVSAAAAGVDISSALSDVNAGLPHYRFSVMTQKATDLCNDVRALGAALLSAIEKRDAEELAVIRATQETQILELIEQVKIDQLEEATENVEGLVKARDVVWERYKHYQKLLGNKEQQKPVIGEAVAEYAFSSNVTIVETGGVKATSYEKKELERLEAANQAQNLAGAFEVLANKAHFVPNFEVSLEPWGIGSATTFGGSNIGAALSSYASFFRNRSARASYEASSASRMGSLALREQEWGLQVNLAAREMMQVDRQIVASKLRGSIADKELQNHRKQTENAKTVESFMREKYSNQELYDWSAGQVSGLYFQTYQLAYDIAKRAERSYRFERGLTDSNFIQFGYWDSLRSGLLAGEKLSQDLRRMEVAYLDQNKREYEIAKDISLVLNAPLALIELKETGKCSVVFPEALFDADYPGHYMRRIKSVSLTIPCVVGPYTSINCTLTLVNNKTRIKSVPVEPYLEEREDGRFINNFAALQSIATSRAQSDSGMFELNFRDERYLPFEGTGVISTWLIEMPKDCNAFDFDTISDVIIRLNYTARDGGELLRSAARRAVILPPQDNLLRFFSARHEFPAGWHGLLHPRAEDDSQTIGLDLSPERFPFQFRGRGIEIGQVELFMMLKDGVTRPEGGVLRVSLTPPGGDAVAGQFQSANSYMNGIPHAVMDVSSGVGTWVLAAQKADVASLIGTLDKADPIEDIIIVCHYSATST